MTLGRGWKRNRFMANVSDGLNRGRSDYQPANNPVSGKNDIGKDYTVQGLLDNLEEIVLKMSN